MSQAKLTTLKLLKWLKALRSKNKKVATIRTLWGSADRGYLL